MAQDIHERKAYSKGALILKQGEDGHSAYLIQSGSVSIFTEQDGKKVELSRLKTGEIFGEMALVVNEPRAASVIAMEDTNVIVISRELYRDKLERTDPMMRAIVQMLVRRVTASNKAIFTKKTDIEDMVKTTQSVYEGVLSTLPRTQQRTFENAVYPRLEQFLNAVKSFSERFKD